MYHKKLTVVSLAVLLSLTLSLIFPVGVLADDNLPPSPDTPEVTTPPEETPSEEEVITEEAPLDHGTEVTDVPIPDSPPDEAAVDLESTTAEIPLLSQVPEGTDVVVLDTEGEVVPLASQEAAEAIAGSDPMWCPDGVSPGGTGCTSGYPNMTQLLSALTGLNQPNQPGTIWIEGSYNSSTAEPGTTTLIEINGNNYLTWRNYSLTIQGGWGGGTTTFSGDRFWIQNWWGDVTIRDITVSGSGGGDALYVDVDIDPADPSPGPFNVTLDNVTVTGSVGNIGAHIDNNENPGTVTVTDSTFTDNGTDGLYIEAMGDVTLQNITAERNGDEGAEVVNTDSTNQSPVQVLSTAGFINKFDTNTGNGLLITSNGAITLENVSASDSANYSGAVLNNNQPGADSSSYIMLTGTNVFNGNDEYGLDIDSKGAVTLHNITADDNERQYGADINNDVSGADAVVSSVTITGDNSFSGNDDYGLEIDSRGAVSLENITADDNKTQYGVNIDNDNTNATAVASFVTITGDNSFSGNDDYGLEIDSRGAVSLENITADGNETQYGVNIDNVSNANASVSSVTISGTNNSFSSNYDYGLEIDSIGTVILNDVTADGNKNGDGVNIDNTGGTGDVRLTDTQTFTNNGNGDGDDGLYIRSSGNVTLVDVIATGNKDEGVDINNTSSTTNRMVQIGGANIFTGNRGTGLLIYSDGAVNLSNVTANTNGTTATSGDGVYIENQSSGAANAGVTLDGTNIFTGNRNNGLYIRSTGAINLSNITAMGIATTVDSGVFLDNDESGAVGGVTITGANNVFSGNNDYGLEIDSRGIVSLENITASDNRLQDGVNIDNDAGTGNVTLTGIQTFTNNGDGDGDDGLYITSRGSLTLANINATFNKDEGVEIDTTPGTGSVTITGGTYNQNFDNGLYVRSRGLITLVDVTANQNGNNGGDVSNSVANSIAGANVFVVRSTFNFNGDDGLYAGSNLDVVLINVTAQNNDNDGVELYSNGDNVVLCGGVFSGNDAGGGSADYNVRLNNGSNTRTRSSDIVVTNWNPATWTTVPNGTGRCNFPDTDTDLLPNTWDTDDDNDLILDGADNCSLVSNADQTNTDGDGEGNACDADDDNDTFSDGADNCSLVSNPDQTNTDGDLEGNACDDDDDNDTVSDGADNCLLVSNPDQKNTDGDGEGNACDDDDDNDTVSDGADNCSLVSNADQMNTDGDLEGNTCDADDDNDSISDTSDACPIGASTGTDTDGDGCKNTEDTDDDGDGMLDTEDACPIGASTGTDTDGDGCKDTEDADDDGDGVPDINDALPFDPNETSDADGDGIGDNADPDDDNDGISDLREIILEGRFAGSLPGSSFFIPVTGAVPLSCTDLSTLLSAGDFQVTFANLCGYSNILTEIPEDALPGALPDNMEFVAGINITLLQDGGLAGTIPADAGIKLSFDIPADLDGESLSILYWDPADNTWVKKSVSVDDGRVILTGAIPGTFVLVKG